MSTTVSEPDRLVVDCDLPLARFTVEQYHRMIEAGALTETDRIELIEGYLVEKMTKSPPHCAALRFLNDLLSKSVPHGCYVATQDPITLDNSEPEPDLTIIRGSLHDHVDRHPGPQDVAVVVEVAVSTLEKDRRMSVTYARNRIPVYWIVNLNDETVEVYTKPQGAGQTAGYGETLVLQRSESVPCVVDGHTCTSVPVDDILP